MQNKNNPTCFEEILSSNLHDRFYFVNYSYAAFSCRTLKVPGNQEQVYG